MTFTSNYNMSKTLTVLNVLALFALILTTGIVAYAGYRDKQGPWEVTRIRYQTDVSEIQVSSFIDQDNICYVTAQTGKEIGSISCLKETERNQEQLQVLTDRK